MAYKSIKLKIANKWYTVSVVDPSRSPVEVIVDGKSYFIEVDNASTSTIPHQSSTKPDHTNPFDHGPNSELHHASDKLMTSPMPGRVMAVNVKPGDSVSIGQTVCVIEAMKMEQDIQTHASGIIKKVHVLPMQQVGYGDILVELE